MRVFLVILSLMAGPALAQEADPANGFALFRANCATCHGLGARGDGPMTSILTITPPDLTQVSAANGGVFPLADVVRRIDGRDMILAHGGAMPIFGFILEDESGVIDDAEGTPVFTKQSVIDIAAWLEAVQE